jgi:hypothetical protein
MRINNAFDYGSAVVTDQRSLWTEKQNSCSSAKLTHSCTVQCTHIFLEKEIGKSRENPLPDSQ